MSTPRSSFIGLKNQGATCYLNSLIQTLFLTPEFRQKLFALTKSDVGLQDDNKDDNNDDNNNNNNNNNNKRKRVIVELQKLFARLQTPSFDFYSSLLALSTKSLTNSFGWDAQQAQDQHDINELYNLLLDGIEKQMPQNQKILKQYYNGKTVNVIECQICHYKSKRFESFHQLNIILNNNSSLKESLMNMYLLNDEELKDDNAYLCGGCNKKVHAIKKVRLTKVPDIIVCNLNRFYYDISKDERVKINSKFKFTKELDLSMFIEDEYKKDNNDIMEYDLMAIVVHRGSGANAGHYHAYIRDLNNEVVWKPIKRNKPKKRGRRGRARGGKRNNNNKYDAKATIKKEKKDKAIAILVTILLDHTELSRFSLASKFTYQNGSSGWDSEFKSYLGTFTNFLKNSHRFKLIYSSATARTFRVRLASDNEFKKSNNNDYSGSSSVEPIINNKNKKNNQNQNKNKKKNKKTPKKKKNDLDGFIVDDDDDDDYVDDVDDVDDVVDDYVDDYIDDYSPMKRKLRGNKRNKQTKDIIDITSVSPKSPSSGPLPLSDDNNNDNNNDNKTDNNNDNDNNANDNGAHWFDFNDEDITAVYDNEIDDLYDGGDEECPYMVIYRRKCMNNSQWPPQIPAYVQSLLIDEPLDAEEDKKEISISIIKLIMGKRLVTKRSFLDISHSDSDNNSNSDYDHDLRIPKINHDTQDGSNQDQDQDHDDEDIDMTQSIPNPQSFLSLPSHLDADDENDDDMDEEELVCKHPDKIIDIDIDSITDNINKQTISNGNHNNNNINGSDSNRKRKFSEIENSENQTIIQKESANGPSKKKRRLGTKENNSSLANLPTPNTDKKTKSKTSKSTSPVLSPNKSNKNKNKNKKNKNSKSKSTSPQVINKKSNKKSINNNKIEKEVVISSYLEPIVITKGTVIKDLYTKISEWSGININDLEICRILNKGRKYSKNPSIVNLKDCDANMKIKHIPLDHNDDIIVWNKNDGNLSEKELLRRKSGLKINVYIHIKGSNDINNEYPSIFYIQKNETLNDLKNQIYNLLNEKQKKLIQNGGRFRDMDTEEIFRQLDLSISKCGIRNDDILNYESDKPPKPNEIVIRYKLKNTNKGCKKSITEEMYVDKNELISTFKIQLCTFFGIDNIDDIDLRRGRKNWSLGTYIDKNKKYIKQCNFNDTQNIILNLKKDPNARLISVYCQIDDNDPNLFKIPKELLVDIKPKLNNNNNNNNKSKKKKKNNNDKKNKKNDNKNKNINDNNNNNNSLITTALNVATALQRPVGQRASNALKQINSADEDGDIVMIDNKDDNKDNKDNDDDDDDKEIIPPHDNLDVYDVNSKLLITLELFKYSTSSDIRRAIVESNKLSLWTKFDKNASIDYMRISQIFTPNSGRGKSKKHWKIMRKDERINQKKGKIIIEFSNNKKPINIPLKLKSRLVFVYKLANNPLNNNNNNDDMSTSAIYGSRYEVIISDTDKKKLNNLKSTIINACDWKSMFKPSDIILASRHLKTHEWTILKEVQIKVTNKKNTPQRKNKKQRYEQGLNVILNDRSIIAVFNAKDLNDKQKNDINSNIFQTEWDKYCIKQYYKKKLNKESSNDDEPDLIINFGFNSVDNSDNNNNDNDNDQDSDDIPIVSTK